ncbi:MAG: MFS transporter [Burkholderiales bacterium]|nr:MFS transporter [Burkholderiales bacterium]OUT78009.1 MAG: AmpG family muropeptide MFS transporter [Betaproteobacteria bacterium TMED22]|tara:strand:+ start:14889 stop:16211 length:1323 start_codon:yes stop_codon:yes gene_type:complete
MNVRDLFTIYTQTNVLRMLFLGFSAGLPLLLVFGTLSFWLREAGLELSAIGFFSWIGLVYAFKWAWSPLVDQLPIPLLNKKLGKRRSWLLLSQITVAVGLIGIATTDPARGISGLIGFALLTAFASATQDIALDAYRIESGLIEDQGAMAATYQMGYRLAMITSSAGALFLASWLDQTDNIYEPKPWMYTYIWMAALMVVGMVTTILSPEPSPNNIHPNPERDARSQSERIVSWFRNAVVMPFVDFIRRYRLQAIILLAMISLYRISDIVMGVMSNPFYIDMGFSKQEIATVSKIFGVIMTILGALVGGSLIKYFGVFKILFIGAALSSLTNLLFAWLSLNEPSIGALTLTVSADNFSAGVASAAFIAYLSSLTNIQYSATQYALFSSLMFLLPKSIAGWSGVFVETWGYAYFFLTTALIGIPSLMLVWFIRRISIEGRP